MKNEMAEKKSTATQGLLWLTRGLSFTCKALQATQKDKDIELSVAFQNAYGVTLKEYHNFIVKQVFNVSTPLFPWLFFLKQELLDACTRLR